MTLPVRRVQVPAIVVRAKMATTWTITGVTSVTLPVRRVQVPAIVLRAKLDYGNVTATPRVAQGVKAVLVTEMTAVVRARLDTGDVIVTHRVVRGVKKICVTTLTADVRVYQATMETSVPNNAKHNAPFVLTVESARHAKRVFTAQSASSIALITARPLRPAQSVTNMENVYTVVSTTLQVSTVTQVREC